MGVIFRSDLIAAAACILLILKFLNINMAFSFIEKHGLETGLLFLLFLTPLLQTEPQIIFGLVLKTHQLQESSSNTCLKCSGNGALNSIYLSLTGCLNPSI
ncbi:DUF441 family protein [Peptococcaceae bacterium]|nr:DUF441 family protein [Peptococcaceae bacterium]